MDLNIISIGDNLENIDKTHQTAEINKDVNYVFHECVRGAKRKHLFGADCNCCKDYYSKNLNLTKNNSRHRNMYEKPKTPPNFWDMDF